ncbi:uncharacterized protein N7500_004020 [Penicillium coprophilum]|uniref:uncharacterized protein n=1 Tax=Penicillium coprophilum TaxID=36646 RepID=UPI00239817C5|nr:uncharacterized protein N7500_004020 [Penicillium coprophilum]KAJ5171237.1 hypothetical protein N7500_004020 [Penicillium coprophilum]
MPTLRSSSQEYVCQMPINASIIYTKQSSTSSIPPVSKKSGAGYISQRRHLSKCSSTGSSSPSAANIAPAEILLEIFSMLTPRDFDNARRTCSLWMRTSLSHKLLEDMLKRAGWWDAWLQDRKTPRISRLDESEVWRMSRRFATECLLSGRKLNVEKPGFLTTAVVDFSGLSGSTGRKSRIRLQPFLQIEGKGPVSTFSTSSCSNYLLVTTGCMIYLYALLGRKSMPTSAKDFSNVDLSLVSRISCPFDVLSAVIDTSKPHFTIAALLSNRVGMICNLDMAWAKVSATKGPLSNGKTATLSRHFFYNVCTVDNPPRTVALCPGQSVVAFGCAAGIEIHSVNETKRNEQRRYFTVPQPSEILHFLPSSPETPSELRLISSLSGPGVHECKCPPSPSPSSSSFSASSPKHNQFHFLADIQSFNRRRIPHAPSRSLIRATHCHHYRAVPINDGFHIMFIEPRTSLLCIGTDAPIGGPTSLTRAFVCVPPPFSNTQNRQIKTPPPSPSLSNTIPPPKDLPIPTTFTAGSDLRWGLRVVAAYDDRLVLYSIPLDVFNMIRKERERQADGVMGDSDLAPAWYVDSERTRKQRESLVQNQNGEWEFVLSVSYRPTAMMWPFKIYGKEIGSVKGTVELALQSSEGGVRVWAFGKDGKGTILDVDTGDAPTRSFGVSSDGGVEDLGLFQRNLGLSRKRKFEELNEFVGYGAGRYSGVDGVKPCAAGVHDIHHPSVRRSSFAACIIDFKIPLY